MSGVVRLLIVAAIVWIGACVYIDWGTYKYLRYPQGEPGWLCEYPATESRLYGLKPGTDTVLPEEDLQACLDLDPAGFVHDNYFYYMRQKRSDAFERIQQRIVPAVAIAIVLIGFAWVRAGFRRS
ncbi:MAG: hypothetical protein H6923_01045 [Alphaproteobacteria bacterium]|nr:hypothetical protein [Alphaproteobacteria bacterium]